MQSAVESVTFFQTRCDRKHGGLMLRYWAMGYIPKDAKWYLADIIEEIRVQGAHLFVGLEVPINKVVDAQQLSSATA